MMAARLTLLSSNVMIMGAGLSVSHLLFSFCPLPPLHTPFSCLLAASALRFFGGLWDPASGFLWTLFLISSFSIRPLKLASYIPKLIREHSWSDGMNRGKL